MIMDSRHVLATAEGKHMTKLNLRKMGQGVSNMDRSPLFLFALQRGRSL